MNDKTQAKPAEAAPKKDKAEAFKALASARMNKALAAISVIGNLSNKGNYTYTEDQVAKIEAALTAEVAAVVAKFKNPTAAPVAGFTL